MAPFDLPRLSLEPVQTIAAPGGGLAYIERPAMEAHVYGQAHAFIGSAENVRVIGSGSLVAENGIYVHGLSTGNYESNIRIQLKQYAEVPDGGDISGEHVLIWGCDNFGHWLITYLMRAALLWYRTELLRLPILLSNKTPKRFVEWLVRMGLTRFRYAPDGARVEKLWVPSVVCYRGHYEDKKPYIFPQALHILRQLVLRNMCLPHPVRERIYLSRAKAKWRRFTNEEELAKVLAANGIKRVFMHELSLERQLDLVSRAELIVIHAGGDSPITMFAPADCRILELNIPIFNGVFASRCWAHILGQKFQRINAAPLTKTGRLPIDCDSTINIEEVVKLL